MYLGYLVSQKLRYLLKKKNNADLIYASFPYVNGIFRREFNEEGSKVEAENMIQPSATIFHICRRVGYEE